jgi:hypothetical protein
MAIMLVQVQKFGRTVFRRASEITLFAACLVLLSNYVGGIGLSVIFGVSVLFWLLFNAYSVLPIHTRYLGALIISLVEFVFITTTVVPVLRSFSWFHSRMMTASPIQERDYISYYRDGIEVLHPWVIISLMVGFSLLALPLIMLSHRSHELEYQSHSKSFRWKYRVHSSLHGTGPTVSRYVALIPLGAIASLQYVNPIRAITFTMSGDGRNVFLYVLRSRLNFSFPTFSGLLQGGKLGETLATGITVSNRTQGFPRLADQYAVRSVYLLMMCIIVCSVAALITAHSREARGSRVVVRDLSVLLIVIFVVVSPYPFAEILRSGFISLFVGIGFLVATIAFVASEKMIRRDVAVLAVICAVATYMSYQVVALLVIPIVFCLTYSLLWNSIKHKATRFALMAVTLLFTFNITSKMTSVADQFSRRVNDGGAIRPTSMVGIVSVFLLAVAFTGVARGRTRYTLLCISAVMGSSLVTLHLIDWARNDTDNRYGYYGQKLMYTANFIAWILVIAMFGLFLSYLGEKLDTRSSVDSQGKKYFWFRNLATASFVVMLTLPVVFLSNAESPALSIYNGWDSPSEEIVARTLDNWNSGNEKYVFALYGTDSNDRMGNFWSPYFWEPNRWEWTYSGYSVEARSLCSVIGGNELTLITDSGDLMRQMRGMCSASLNQVTVEN